MMTTQDIIKDIMTKQGQTNASLANKLGISQAALWDRLNNNKRKELSISVLLKMLTLLDYKIQIVPRTKKLSDDSYELKQDVTKVESPILPNGKIKLVVGQKDEEFIKRLSQSDLPQGVQDVDVRKTESPILPNGRIKLI